MMFFNALYIALCEIRRNLMRSFLTVLGIIIGVAAVITMVTLGNGATSAVKEQISNLGSNLLVLRPGSGFGPGSRSSGVPNFSEQDAEALREQIAGLAYVAPLGSANLSTIYMQNARSSEITGTTPEYFPIGKWSLESGRFFEDADVLSGNAVCVLGSTVKKELFGNADPLGEKIRIGKSSIEVIGILKTKGQVGSGKDQDDTIVMPLTTLQRRLVGKQSANDIGSILISTEDDVDTEAVISEISLLMRERRNLQDNVNDNFSVIDTRQIADAVSSSTQVMTTLLGAVAGVSLLVGGIGIMNIMLVSVTERTREIGIRLAVGARAREVLLQFLVEAVTLACIGGLIGLTLAYGLCVLLSKVIQVPFVFDSEINLTAFLFSGAVGVLFGFMPARRAASLDPIDALRHE